jgi:hypothetical protein
MLVFIMSRYRGAPGHFEKPDNIFNAFSIEIAFSQYALKKYHRGLLPLQRHS